MMEKSPVLFSEEACISNNNNKQGQMVAIKCGRNRSLDALSSLPLSLSLSLSLSLLVLVFMTKVGWMPTSK
jgi:hypothetical protein